MKTFVLSVIAAAGLAGCAGADYQVRDLTDSNALRVEQARTPGADYVVIVRNLVGLGFNPDDKATRDEIALHATNLQCPTGRVVDETVTDTGTYAIGRASRTYRVRIKC